MERVPDLRRGLGQARVVYVAPTGVGRSASRHSAPRVRVEVVDGLVPRLGARAVSSLVQSPEAARGRGPRVWYTPKAVGRAQAIHSQGGA